MLAMDRFFNKNGLN